LRGEGDPDSKFSINPGDSFRMPYMHSVQYTLLRKYLRCASACGLSSVWIVGSLEVQNLGLASIQQQRINYDVDSARLMLELLQHINEEGKICQYILC